MHLREHLASTLLSETNKAYLFSTAEYNKIKLAFISKHYKTQSSALAAGLIFSH